MNYQIYYRKYINVPGWPNSEGDVIGTIKWIDIENILYTTYKKSSRTY